MCLKLGKIWLISMFSVCFGCVSWYIEMNDDNVVRNHNRNIAKNVDLCRFDC